MFSLFKKRYFAPFFLTQFWGAFNDNLFKNALILLITFNSAANITDTSSDGIAQSHLLVNISAILFILPFFLFSSLAGQIGDKFEKSTIIRKIKLLEMVIMLLGAFFFIYENTYALMVILFLMGTQSALFGPVKYSIMPQHLTKEQLLKGNSLVETGTFIAILSGTIYAGLTVNIEGAGKYIVAASLVIIAVFGYLSSIFIPNAPANNPELKINYNPITETGNLLKEMKLQPVSVSRSIIGISWFWFIGAIYIAQLPSYTKDFLHADETVFTLLLTLFSIGIGIGSILCEKLSDDDVELGLVPVGAIGLTLFGVLLYFSTQTYIAALPTNIAGLDYIAFLAQNNSYTVLTHIFFIGVFGGIYTVPLYTLIQMRTQEKTRSRVIAANNVWNALFMVLSGVYAIVMLQYFNVVEVLLSVMLLNILVSLYIFTIVPEFAMRFLTWCMLKFMYRIHVENINVPKEGRLVLVCNHVSFVDAMIIASAIRRPVRFIMYYKIFNIPILNFIFKHSKAIPIAGIKEDKAIFDQAFIDIKQALEADEAIFIFPEGRLTSDGEIGEFKAGVERIIQQTPAPVYPIALQGLWGSYFSRKKGKFPFKRIYSHVTIKGGTIMTPEESDRVTLHKAVSDLRGDKQ